MTDSPDFWRPWAELLKRSFDIDLRCHATMKLKSFLTSPKSLNRLLTQLGEPTEVKGKAPASGPPYYSSKVVRRHFGEHAPQVGCSTEPPPGPAWRGRVLTLTRKEELRPLLDSLVPVQPRSGSRRALSNALPGPLAPLSVS